VPERFRPAALAGIYDPRGRIDRDDASSRITRVLGGIDARSPYADAWLVVGVTGNGFAEVTADGCAMLEGRIENRVQLAQALDLPATAPPEAVLAAGYRRWGDDVLARLRGSFATVLWDAPRRVGALAIDQLGGRSLFYLSQGDGSLAFASEIRVLLDLLSRRPAPKESAVAQWLLELSLSPRETLFEGVERVEAGAYLRLGEGWRPSTYWFPRYERPDNRASREEVAAALWAQVVRSVDAKTDPHDRPAIILSGGIDSSVVAAAAVELAGRGKPAPRTYSAVFPGDGRIDESERIDSLVDALDLTSVQIRLQPSGAFRLALDYLDVWNLPLPGPGAALEQPLVERAAAEGATVIFDGQAGDEIFGRPTFLVADRLRRGRLISSLRLAVSFPPPAGVTRANRWRGAYRIWKFAGLQGALPGRLHTALRELRKRDRVLPAWLDLPPGSYDPQVPDPWGWKHYRGPRWWAGQVYTVAKMRDALGSNDYIRHRAAVVGADARPPLLDVDLIEFALRMPPRLSFDGSVQDRPLIREALRGRVPELIRLNPVKSNVAAFYYETLAGADLAPIRRLLTEGDVQVAAYVERRTMAALLDERPGVGGRGWYEWFSAVWKLATIEAWLRQQADSTFAERARAASDVSPTARADHRVRGRQQG
jgi:asparagine synthetase B (glutamine-hydrolysing)